MKRERKLQQENLQIWTAEKRETKFHCAFNDLAVQKIQHQIDAFGEFQGTQERERLRNLIITKFIVQAGSADFENPSRSGSIALGFSERLQDSQPFGFLTGSLTDRL